MTESPYARRRRRSASRHRGPEGPAASSAAGDPEPDPREVARSIVLRQLTASPKSRQQLEEKLADRNVSEDVAREVLDRFEEVDLVDDAQFAEVYVRSRASSRKLSRSAIRRELATRGVTGETAEAALEQRTDEDERADAAELVRRRFPAAADLTDRAERDRAVRRLVGMLGRKGYAPGLAFAVVQDELAARTGSAGPAGALDAAPDDEPDLDTP
ncbi:regulatory protein RecX [Kocuria sp. M1R5S2]|uniref:regulatory protein RecX n=1 Tax=Kocuria rhizosphaerae TaxID=3376285 RepID=UPI0037AF1475